MQGNEAKADLWFGDYRERARAGRERTGYEDRLLDVPRFVAFEDGRVRGHVLRFGFVQGVIRASFKLM